MKAILFAFALMVLLAYATSLGLLIVKMPVYLHGSDSDTVIQIVDIPVMNASDTNEAKYGGICHAFVPPNLSTWVKPVNINIAHEHGIHVVMEEVMKRTFLIGSSPSTPPRQKDRRTTLSRLSK